MGFLQSALGLNPVGLTDLLRGQDNEIRLQIDSDSRGLHVSFVRCWAGQGSKAVRLPVYLVVGSEAGMAEADALCKEGDMIISGGCVMRAMDGSDTCTTARSYPISPNMWHCRATKANGAHSDCRATALATCLKSK
jgi:hypothetical protein